MDEDIKKKVAIGIAVGCIVIAGAIAFMTTRGGSGDSKTKGKQVQYLCINPKCGNAFEAGREVLNRLQEEGISQAEMPPMKCPKCGEDSAYVAIKCEKCGNVFIPNYENPKEYDKCPKCGFSKREQTQKK
jgi:DNA-directed RNA polymerase subunit RPC12/RpoP